MEQGGSERKTIVRVLAPAKVNLFLRIIGQRSDGYHLLDSLMAPVSLYDEIEITAEPRTDTEQYISVTCDNPAIPTDQSNLVYRAASLLCQDMGIGANIAITLQKKIPAGAGLGGGSSDAAAVLKALNQLLVLGLTTQELCVLAARLGADVPFFVPCVLSRVGGIGEILQPFPALPQRWLVLMIPSFAVSTPWAYQRFDELHPNALALEAEDIDWAPRLDSGLWPDPALFINDLERAVLPTYPLLAEHKKKLQTLGAEMALMSGSGSAVFGVFTTWEQAERAAAALADLENVFLVTLLDETLHERKDSYGG